jgi:tripartite-type tricarboxylate transporter receptor subunit TctC
MKKLLTLLLAALPMALAAPAALAQPTKPIRIIMPTGAGGPSDVVARALGQSLSTALGQPVVIDNRPGANGVLAAQALAGAPTDGTVLLWAIASMATIPMVQKSPPFRSLADFAPVSLVAVNVFGVFVHPSVPANTLGDLAAHLRANPDKLTYASGTLGEYLAGVSFLRAADARALRVPYRSGTQAMQDLLAGRAQFHLAPLGLGLPHVKDGKLRLLAVLASERSPLAPDVPTMSEAGFPNVIVPTWQSLVAPAGTPKAVTERLAREVEMALRDPGVRGQLEQIGMQVRGQGSDALAATIARDTEVWRAFVRDNDVGQE